MVRENRYVVFKRSDIFKYLSEKELDALDKLRKKVRQGRIDDGKRIDKFVCVADDWPEYPVVWEMIEQRMDGTPQQIQITFSKFREANVTRCIKWHPQGINSWSASDWLTAITGELGELASLIKMLNRERDGLPGNKFSPTKHHIANEIADVFTYLDLLAASMNIDLGTAVVWKFNEVSARVGFPDRIEK